MELNTIINILISLAFYLQIIVTIQDKNKHPDIISFMLLFITLYTLIAELYNKNTIILYADIFMTIVLMVFLYYDFSKMSIETYNNHPYYKFLKYASYFMICINVVYLFYIIFSMSTITNPSSITSSEQ